MPIVFSKSSLTICIYFRADIVRAPPNCKQCNTPLNQPQKVLPKFYSPQVTRKTYQPLQSPTPHHYNKPCKYLAHVITFVDELCCLSLIYAHQLCCGLSNKLTDECTVHRKFQFNCLLCIGLVSRGILGSLQ